MSVIITGMNKPTTCRKCKFQEVKSQYGHGENFSYSVNCMGMIDYIGVPPEGCCLKEVVYCKFCKYNYGLAHGGEFNNNDIVCDYFNTDGLHEDDFCSHGIRKEGESEKAGQDKFER